jgi:hypothetical protein
MKGNTVKSSFGEATLPQQAITPIVLVDFIIFSRITPPTVSTAPAKAGFKAVYYPWIQNLLA